MHTKAQDLYSLLVLRFWSSSEAYAKQYKQHRAYAKKVYSSPIAIGGLYTQRRHLLLPCSDLACFLKSSEVSKTVKTSVNKRLLCNCFLTLPASTILFYVCVFPRCGTTRALRSECVPSHFFMSCTQSACKGTTFF